MLSEIADFALAHMSTSEDVSHDHYHLKRVVEHTETILNSDEFSGWNDEQRERTLVLAYIHDLCDHKLPKEHHANIHALLQGREDMDLLLVLVKHVSWSYEQKHLDEVEQLVMQYPELGIVQDADRLDAIGVTGMLRAAAFSQKLGVPLVENVIQHTNEKLLKITFNTKFGQYMAETRRESMENFLSLL